MDTRGGADGGPPADGAGPQGVPATLVVRRSDGWSFGNLHERVPTDVDLADVLALAGTPGRRRPADAVPPLHPDAVLEPVSAFVGWPTPEGLEVEGPGARSATLDHIDLRLLDAVSHESRAGDVASSVEPVEPVEPAHALLVRLRALCELGRVRLAWEPEPAAEDDQPEAVTPAPPVVIRGPRFPGRRQLGRLRRALRRSLRPTAAPVAADVDDTGPGDHTGPEEVEPADEAAVAELRYLSSPQLEGGGEVPVYAMFVPEAGPPLSLGMLTAAARHHDGGSLLAHYDVRRPEGPASVLADLAQRRGPAVLLLSNYLWSVDRNLELAERAKALEPDLLVVHGGPSTPQYEADTRRFFEEHPDIVDVAVRSEGEVTLSEVLTAVVPGLPGWELDRLHDVAGLSYRDPATGEVRRTEDRDRVVDLDALPSPYLTGEYDHLDPSAWDEAPLILETNRGCPYGCTFCDWGSSTLSRIRRFDLERVGAEMRWAGERGLRSWAVADANVGIMSRDVDVARLVATERTERGVPVHLGFNVAKNTTKHLTAIMGTLVEAGVAPHVSLALQTRDEATLEAVRRTNISAEHYVSLAATFRRHGLPLMADIMLGLPGQTVDSLTGDLQFLMDHEVQARIWITQLLPNSPMNDPEYRKEWGVVSDENGVVVATSSFGTEDRAEMMRLRYAHTVLERYGTLRQVMRFLQWDQGIPATSLMHRALAVSVEDPLRYPLLSWMLRYFDFFHVPPVGWHRFFQEIRRFLSDEMGVTPSPPLDTVLTLQEFLLPEHGRQVPDEIELDHDFVQYYRDATRSLWSEGVASGATAPLETYPPARFSVYGDPMDRCGRQMGVAADPRNENMTDAFWSSGHMELDSPLVVGTAEIVAHGGFIGLLEQVPDDLDLDEEQAPRERRNPIPVAISSRPHTDGG